MKILGIDPGTATTGWAVVEEINPPSLKLRSHAARAFGDGARASKNPHLIACGCINTSKLRSNEERLVEIGRDIASLIKKYQPAEAAIEDLFFFKNLKTAITVAQARGVILYEIKRNLIPLYSYTPLQVKQALTGYGRADKNQIQEMVKNILKLKSIPKPDDAADAVAIAICHLNSRNMKSITQNARNEIK